MEVDPNYTIWHPRMFSSSDGDVIVFNVTPSAYDKMASGPSDFFENFLKDLGISVKIKRWDVLAYRSNYHGERDDDCGWNSIWPVNWKVSVILKENLTDFFDFHFEYIETYNYPVDIDLVMKLPDELNCLLISDFRTKNELLQAREEISSLNRNRGLDGVGLFRNIEFNDFKIHKNCFQLQINIGNFPVHFYESGADAALIVEDICRHAGGITSFDERANNWGEI